MGNSVFPLLEINPTVHVYACDFAETGVDIVRRHPLYLSSGRATAFVADLTANDLLQHVPRGIVDACTMIFVLSAISPEAMPAAIANVARTLVPGKGQVLFRDYCRGDLAQERLQEGGKQQRIGEGFYMRGDGTRAYYFTEKDVRDLFQAAGFRCESLKIIDRVQINRGTGTNRERKFLQGVFVLESAVNSETWEPAGVAPPAEQGGNSPTEESLPNGMLEKVAEMIQIGHLKLHLQGISKENLGTSSPSVVLASLVLRCPSFFLDRNVLEVHSGAAALPTLATLRWCRRALAIDAREKSVEYLKRNAVHNGWQFAYERLRVAVERPEAREGWAEAAFQGPIGGVLAAVSEPFPDRDMAKTIEDTLRSAKRALSAENEALIVLFLGEKCSKSVAVVAKQLSLVPCETPLEFAEALTASDLCGNYMHIFRKGILESSGM